jgi:hypothetical protein
MQAEHHPGVSLHLLLVVGVRQEDEDRPVDPHRRLDHEGAEALPRPGVDVLEALAGVLLVARQVEVGAVVDALQLLPPEGELVLDVDGLLGVVGEFVGAVLVEPEALGSDPQRPVPRHPLLAPVLEPLVVGAGLHEELHLGLFELPGPEDEVPGRDLVAEGLADLGDAEGHLLPRGGLHVQEVDVRPLRRLGAQVDGGRVLLDRPHEGLEHEVEESRLPEFAVLGLARVLRGLAPAGLHRELVLPEALLAGLALHQRIREPLHVARRLPDPGMHQDRRIQPLDVVPLVHHPGPPALLHVALELDPERAVVPDRAGASVDLGGLEDESASLGQRHELLHQVMLGHGRARS